LPALFGLVNVVRDHGFVSGPLCAPHVMVEVMCDFALV